MNKRASFQQLCCPLKSPQLKDKDSLTPAALDGQELVNRHLLYYFRLMINFRAKRRPSSIPQDLTFNFNSVFALLT